MGEIVAYIVPKGSAGAGAQVIHRIVGGDERKGFIVQGDNRTAPDVWHPRRAEIVGTAWAHVPKAGIVIVFLHNPAFLASLAAALTAGFFVLRSGKKPGPVTPPSD